MGWLHAIPETKSENKQSRIESLRDNEDEIIMPPVNAGMYIIEYWQDIGMVSYGGMGEIPITNVELMAWCNGLGLVLNAFEFRTIKRLSLDYISSKRKGENAVCSSPYSDVLLTEKRQKVSDDIDRLFSGYSVKKGL